MKITNLRTGDVIKFIPKEEWGFGKILYKTNKKITCYFTNIGQKSIALQNENIDFTVNIKTIYGEEANQPLFKVFDFQYEKSADARYNIYVIKLSIRVKGRENLPALYVGQTIKSPEKRFEEHKKGYHSSHIVKEYGEKLLPQYYDYFNPIVHRKDAIKLEELISQCLIEQGYFVHYS